MFNKESCEERANAGSKECMTVKIKQTENMKNNMGLSSLDRQWVRFEPATCPWNKPKCVHSELRW